MPRFLNLIILQSELLLFVIIIIIIDIIIKHYYSYRDAQCCRSPVHAENTPADGEALLSELCEACDQPVQVRPWSKGISWNLHHDG